jgi:hypothetical protein
MTAQRRFPDIEPIRTLYVSDVAVAVFGARELDDRSAVVL